MKTDVWYCVDRKALNTLAVYLEDTRKRLLWRGGEKPTQFLPPDDEFPLWANVYGDKLTYSSQNTGDPECKTQDIHSAHIVLSEDFGTNVISDINYHTTKP